MTGDILTTTCPNCGARRAGLTPSHFARVDGRPCNSCSAKLKYRNNRALHRTHTDGHSRKKMGGGYCVIDTEMERLMTASFRRVTGRCPIADHEEK